MRLKISKSAHSLSYSVIKSAYINGKRTSVVVERLGNTEEIKAKAGDMNALAEKAARGPILKGDDFSAIDEEASEIRDLLLYYLQT